MPTTLYIDHQLGGAALLDPRREEHGHEATVENSLTSISVSPLETEEQSGS